VTPEYNRSIPGLLKNAIDVGSRPYGQAVWSGKPAAIMSTSMGALGGFGANHHLRQVLTFFDMPVLQQPEAYVGNTGTLFDENGDVTIQATADSFTATIEAFARLVEHNVPATPLAAGSPAPRSPGRGFPGLTEQPADRSLARHAVGAG